MEKVKSVIELRMEILEEAKMKEEMLYRGIFEELSGDELMSFFINNDMRIMLAGYIAWKTGYVGDFATIKERSELQYHVELKKISEIIEGINFEKLRDTKHGERYENMLETYITVSNGEIQVFSIYDSFESGYSNEDVSITLGGRIYFEFLDRIFSNHIGEINQKIA